MKHIVGRAVVVMVAAGLGSAPARAIEEMTVTTQKREQSLRDVPVAVSAFDESFMKEAHVEDYRGLVQLTPGFSGATDDGFTDALNIRGISTSDFGIGSDPSVPIFLDGVWEGRTGGAATSFLDVERAEVVRGPQNTLFGRNAIAGAVSVTSNAPKFQEFSGRLGAVLEQYDHYELSGTVNVPLGDAWALRASALRYDENGYLKNLEGGHDLGAHTRTAAQAALRFQSSPVDATLRLFYEERRGDPSVYWSTYPLAPDGTLDPNGTPLPKNRIASDLNAQGNGRDKSSIFRASLNAVVDLPASYSLTSITGFKAYDFFYREDYDATAAPTNNYQQDMTVHYVSQEFRVNSPGKGPIVWFAGVSGYNEKIDAIFDNIYDEQALCTAVLLTDGEAPAGCEGPGPFLANKSERSYNDGNYYGFGLYADATWTVTPKFDITLGARYTWDHKEMRISVLDSGGALGNNFVWPYFTDGFVSDSHDWAKFTPRLAANYRLNEQWSVFANVATGYKAGGYSTFGLDLPAGTAPDDTGLVPPGTRPKYFGPEKNLSFELGTRSRLFHDTLQTNLSAYHYIYEDLQNIVFENGAQITRNVAKANGTGLELEVRYEPSNLWDFVATGALSWTHIDGATQEFIDAADCDPKGNELWNSPHLMTNEMVTRHFPLRGGSDVYIGAEHHYQGAMYAGACNLGLSRAPSWNEFNFRVGYDSGGKWTAAVYLQNALNAQHFERGWENADANNEAGYGLVNTLTWPSKPRTVGARVDYRW